MDNDPLKTLFPQREVSIANGRVVKMRPIPLRNLPKVFNSFMVILALKSQGIGPFDMLGLALDHVLDLLDECMIDATTQELESADAPFLLEVFLDQNLSETVMGKWRTLGGRLTTMFPELKNITKEVQNAGIATTAPTSSEGL